MSFVQIDAFGIRHSAFGIASLVPERVCAVKKSLLGPFFHAVLRMSRQRVREILAKCPQHRHKELAFGFGVVNLLGEGHRAKVLRLYPCHS